MMADQRGMGFPQGGQGTFGVMQGNPGFPMMQQQFSGMPQQGNPMVQQQQFPNMHQPNPMMQQQQMMMQQRAQFQAQMFPNQGSFGHSYYYNQFAGARMPYGVGPPPYTPQMAQNFRAKHDKPGVPQAKLMEDQRRQMEKAAAQQRKQMEQALKQRKFQEQQKKLREFGALGTRKMDADSLISHIIGTPKAGGKPQQPPGGMQNAAVPGSVPAQQMSGQSSFDSTSSLPASDGFGFEDDGFGDFMQGPSVPAAHQAVTAAPPANHQAPAMPASSQLEAPTQPSTEQAPPTGPAEEAAVEDKKDLMSYMMECSDLSAPAKAKHFCKPSVREVQPKRGKTITYQQSQKARHWDSQGEQNLTELFTLPTPAPPAVLPTEVPVVASADGNAPAPVYQHVDPTTGQPSWLPKWLTGEIPPPKVYLQVEEAVTIENKIDTGKVYSVLLRSGLPREVLGQIWTVANRKSPGQLAAQELYMVLALVSIAQNNMDVTQLEVLGRCPQAPIPNLGQNQPSAVPFNQPTPVPDQQPPPSHTSPSQPHIHAPGPPPGVMPAHGPGLAHNSHSAATLASPTDDEFADFQQAPLPKSSSFGDFTAASPVRPGLPPIPQVPSAGIPEARFPTMPTVGAPQPAALPQMIGEEDKYSVLRSFTEAAPTGAPGMADGDDDFDDFKAAESDFKMADTGPGLPQPEMFSLSRQPDIPAVHAGPVPQQSHAPVADEFADFKSVEAGSVDEFADFQSVAPPVANPVNDKIAALKALVSDSKMYEAKKEEVKDENADESEWADFREASTGDFGGDVNHPVVDTGSSADWQADSLSAPQSNPADTDPGGWADFTSASAPSDNVAELPVMQSGSSDWLAGMQSDKHINWGDMGQAQNEEEFASFESGPPPLDNSHTNFTNPESDAKTNSAKSNSSKHRRYDYFGRSSEPKISAGTGLSALDTLPPDLPDMREDDDEDFDKFGTFQGLGSGIAALGIDDDLPNGSIDMFGYSSQPRPSRPERDMADNVSTSSSEYSGWKGRTSAARTGEDNQSLSSLDLPNTKPRPNSKDDSPTGDSQSVSSLEFGNPVTVSRLAGTPGDDRSIASLDLKAVITPDEGPIREQAGFGEFSTAADLTKSDSRVPPSDSIGSFDSATDMGKQDGNSVMSESFGEFSSANNSGSDFPTPQTENKDFIQRPRNASDLLAAGEVSRFGDRYSGLSRESQEDDHPSHSWERILDKALEMLQQANNALSDVSSSAVLQEVLESEQGRLYLEGIVEVYRLVRKIGLAMKALSAGNAKLKETLKEVETTWSSLSSYFCGTAIMPSEASMNFMAAVLKADMDDAKTKACGVCLLNVDARPRAKDYEVHKLTYGGRQYHSPCANFWVNCVDLMLPALKIPELL